MKTDMEKSADGTGTLGLYIHIPFCRQKCLYCDFCSSPDYTEETVDGYVSSLIREAEKYSETFRRRETDTVYFGGGTPTLLPIRQFDRLMCALHKSFNILPSAEITAECNPATVDYSYLSSLRSLGINRLSIGVQSANDNELRALGRIHTFSDAKRTFDDAHRSGFENLSADVMFGIPEQTESSFADTLSKICQLGVKHVSAYGLKIEDGTPFAKMRDFLVLPDEDSEYNMYVCAAEILASHGIQRYEISNFSKKGYESRHNLKYWKYNDYLGLGVAAHSFLDGIRFSNSKDIAAYIKGADICDSYSEISKKDAENEYIMLGMRLADGIDAKLFYERFGVDFESAFGNELRQFTESGHIISRDGRYFFSDKGIYVSNYILSSLLDL